jgi:hypothetical protein
VVAKAEGDPEPDPDDGYSGTYAPSGRWSARGIDPRPQKFDPRQIRAYTGLNQFTIDPAKYEHQPTTWLRQMHMVLTNQGIPPKYWVTEALKCVSADIKTKYMFEVMRPGTCVGNWELYDLNNPPLPDSLDLARVFARTLQLNLGSGGWRPPGVYVCRPRTHSCPGIAGSACTLVPPSFRLRDFRGAVFTAVLALARDILWSRIHRSITLKFGTLGHTT